MIVTQSPLSVAEVWTGAFDLRAVEEIAKMFRSDARLMRVTLVPEWADYEAHHESSSGQAVVVVRGLPWVMQAFRPLTERKADNSALETRPSP